MPDIAIPVNIQILAAMFGLQITLPAALIAGLAWARPRSRGSWLAGVLVVGTYLAALAVIGQFGTPLPWYAPLVYAALAAAAAALAWRRRRHDRPSPAGRLWLWSRLAVAVGLAVLTGIAVAGYRAPQAPTVDLRFPLDNGHYYVAAGGSSLLINHHLVTLDDPFRRDYRGQSFGVDITALNALGRSASGLMPTDPAAYVIFGRPVHAPCSGRVLRRQDGAPDMPVPRRDLSQPLGNHVIIGCRGVRVVLAHLRNGSVAVSVGDRLEAGDVVGRVGNSGQTTAPHLHIHAQRAGARYAPLRADPVVIRFDDRYPVRNAHFRR